MCMLMSAMMIILTEMVTVQKILVFVLVIYLKRIVGGCGLWDGDANRIDFYRTCTYTDHHLS